MYKLFAVIILITIITTTTLGQDQKPEPKNYVEVRGSKNYQYTDYIRSITAKLVGEITYIHNPGQQQVFAGLGHTLILAKSGSVSLMLYGVASTNRQAGLMPAIVPSIQKGRLKSNAFLGWFIPIKGDARQYLVLDTWDTTVEVTKKLDLGSSVGFFLQNGRWNTQAGPIARLKLDTLGSWAISQRFGPGGKELRFIRTFVF